MGPTAAKAFTEAAFDAILSDHLAVVERSRVLLPAIAALSREVCLVLERGNKVLICGNGGSAADSQHIATELSIRFETERPGLPALALTTDTSALTAAANDFGADSIFARQVSALGAAGDLLLGLTTSGTSRNVLAAFAAARAKGLRTACLTGRDGGRARDAADLCLVVPSASTARIQEVHILIGHAICAAVDRAFA